MKPRLIRKSFYLNIFERLGCILTAFFILYSHFGSCQQDFKPTLHELDFIAEFGDITIAEEKLLSKIKALKRGSDDLLLLNHCELAGKLYYDQSDIEIAHGYWEEAYDLALSKFGNRSIEFALANTYLSKYYNFRISRDSALLFARAGLDICRLALKREPVKDAAKIYQSYAYALKIKMETDDVPLSRKLARLYLDTALQLHTRYNAKDIIERAKILKDIGNTWTDESLHYGLLYDRKKCDEYYLKANIFYDDALGLMQRHGIRKGSTIANIYFLKAIAAIYNNGPKYNTQVLQNCQKAICAISSNFSDTSLIAAPNEKVKFLNSTLALNILRFKIERFYFEYTQKGDVRFLEYAYWHSKQAVTIWEDVFKNLKSHEIHKALETYGVSPLQAAIKSSYDFYLLKPDDRVANNIFSWMDLHKYSVLLKKQLDQHVVKFKPNQESIKVTQAKLLPDEALIEYYYEEGRLYCVTMSRKSFTFFPIIKTKYLGLEIDTLLQNLTQHNSEAYCSTSSALYKLLLQKPIEKLDSSIHKLIIIPHGALVRLPFEALVLNKATSYQSANFLVYHYSIRYGLSNGLSLLPAYNAADTLSVFKGEYDQKSILPFSEILIEDLSHSNFKMKAFKPEKVVNESGILHVAAHAFADPVESRESYILLSDREKWFMRDLSNRKFNYSLAVLSACETASGIQEYGEGAINFSRFFYLSGVKSTITTLWKVDDQATAEVLKNFYLGLNTHSASESLSEAKRGYLKQNTSVDDYDPYYWAGLIYTGRDLTFDGDERLGYGTMIFSGIAVLIIVLFLLYKFFF